MQLSWVTELAETQGVFGLQSSICNQDAMQSSACTAPKKAESVTEVPKGPKPSQKSSGTVPKCMQGAESNPRRMCALKRSTGVVRTNSVTAVCWCAYTMRMRRFVAHGEIASVALAGTVAPADPGANVHMPPKTHASFLRASTPFHLCVVGCSRDHELQRHHARPHVRATLGSRASRRLNAGPQTPARWLPLPSTSKDSEKLRMLYRCKYQLLHKRPCKRVVGKKHVKQPQSQNGPRSSVDGE